MPMSPSAIQKTNVGLNLLRDAMANNNLSVVKYVALGTGSTTPALGDTKLVNEVFRKAVTSYTNGATGELFINMYLAPGDSVGTDIEEVGFFGGATATSSANSGVLIARGLFSHNPKTNLESIQFQLDQIFS